MCMECDVCPLIEGTLPIPPPIDEARRPKFEKLKSQPSKEEVEEHELTHMPYRSWCAHCIRGKAEAGPHRAEEHDDEEVPLVSMDYTFPDVGADVEESEEGEKGMPVM